MDVLVCNNNNVGGWYFDCGFEQLVICGVGWLVFGVEVFMQIKQILLIIEGSGIVIIGDVVVVELGVEICQGVVMMLVWDENGFVVFWGEVVFGVVFKCMGVNINVIIEGINV